MPTANVWRPDGTWLCGFHTASTPALLHLSRTHKHMVPMIRQEVTVGLVIGWHRYLVPADAAEMAVVIIPGLVFPQGGGEEETIV